MERNEKENNLRVVVGEKIKAIRKLRGYSQDDLANLMSLTRTSIVNIEKGRQGLTIENLWALLGHLKISPADILPAAEWDKDLILQSKIQELELECKSLKDKYYSLVDSIKKVQSHLTP